jgi:hypothetical protein
MRKIPLSLAKKKKAKKINKLNLFMTFSNRQNRDSKVTNSRNRQNQLRESIEWKTTLRNREGMNNISNNLIITRTRPASKLEKSLTTYFHNNLLKFGA